MKTCILDADSLIYFCCHNKKGDPEKTLDEAKEHLDSWLLGIFNKTYSTHYIMYLTTGISFRKKYFPEYKANRKDHEKPRYFSEIKEYLRSKYQAISYPELEADDLCLITSTVYSHNKILGDEVFISSPDKDILNLEGEHYNYRTGIWKVTTEDEAKYYFWSILIQGDTADNVKGLPGKGAAFVKKLLTDVQIEHVPATVFNTYLEYFGIDKGIEEFYKNYKALKILDFHEDFQKIIPLPIQVIYPSEENKN